MRNTQPGSVCCIGRDCSDERDFRRQQQAIMASLSHELRTPLSSIISNLELHLDDGNDGERTFVQNAMRSAKLLSVLARQLTQMHAPPCKLLKLFQQERF